MMIDKKISKTEMTHLAGISTNAMAKLGRDEDVRINILEKLCLVLDCKLDDIRGTAQGGGNACSYYR